MNHDLICAWLGLPAGVWPPDHYSLLGLKAGENDPRLIEESVHERLDAVRRYQMTNADLATEAMNRLAQAFVCLSEPASKRVYDAGLLGAAAVAEPPAAMAADTADALPATVIEDRDPLVLVYDPETASFAPPVRRQDPIQAAEPVPVALPAEPVVESTPVADTKRQRYKSIVQTRRLLDLWNRAGKYVANPKRRLARASEVKNLLRALRDVREELRTFPPVFGAAGQPGNAVLSLSQLTALSMFENLAPDQREAISLDWQAGRELLLTHRDYLRQEVRALHRRTIFHRLGRLARTIVAEYPGGILVAVAVFALGIGVLRTYVPIVVEHMSKPSKVDSGGEDK
jgi:hypothetical protein